MAPIAELLSAKVTYTEDDELFASWPGQFDSNLVDDGFGQFLEAVPSCTGSCPADFDRRMVASGSFSSESEPALLRKGRSLSSELAPANAEPETKKLTAAERKLQSNRKAQKRFRQKQKVSLARSWRSAAASHLCRGFCPLTSTRCNSCCAPRRSVHKMLKCGC